MKAFWHCCLAMLLTALAAGEASAQHITNTLGTGGYFKIKMGTTDYFTLSQSTGNSTFYRNIEAGDQQNSSGTVGVITKGGFPFIHTYSNVANNGGNTFVGINAGNFTMTGVNGYDAADNTGIGHSTLKSLTSGRHNSAVGTQALTSATTGNFNSGFGYMSLYTNSNGNYNSGFGCEALYFNDGGSNNSAVGYQALYSLNSGSYNTAVGRDAGYNVTTGTNLTLLGYNARPSSATAADEITLGNSSVGALRCNVQAISALSDARDKKNIRDLDAGLEFLMIVRPRVFNWDRREWYDDGQVDGSKMEKTQTAGFIAQELDVAQTAGHAEWLRLVLKNNPERLEATPGNLLPVLVRGVQELKRENDALKEKVLLQQKEIESLNELKGKVARLEEAIARSPQIQSVSVSAER